MKILELILENGKIIFFLSITIILEKDWSGKINILKNSKNMYKSY